MRVLLTGSSGWLGRHVAPKLQQQGHEVIGMDLVSGEFTTIIGTVADPDLVRKAFSDHEIEAVVHSGALHKPDVSRFAAAQFVEVHVKGTLNLLDAAVEAGHDRFVFTSTTSLMIDKQIRAGAEGGAAAAFWLDENFGPLRPRNIYGVTKLSAEQLCHLYSELYGLDIAILRTSRFFPENDDTLFSLSGNSLTGENLKANEFLNRRIAVADAADAHVLALSAIKGMKCRCYIVSAATPFSVEDCQALISDAATVIDRYFPKATSLYSSRGWKLPNSIERVYDSSLIERELGFRAQVDFSAVLLALEKGGSLPFDHMPEYQSPIERSDYGLK